MSTLFRANGSGWNLEVVGRIPKLPPFIDSTPNSSIQAVNVLAMERLCVDSDQLLPLAPDEQIEPLFFEATPYDIHFERTNPTARLVLPAGAELRRTSGNSDHYVINFGNNVGFTTLEVECDRLVSKIRLEVFARKIDYRKDYVEMRREVSAHLRNLAMAANSRTYGLAAPSRTRGANLVEWFALVQVHFKEFRMLLRLIMEAPHVKLVASSVPARTDRARQVSRQSIAKAVKRSGRGPVHSALGVALPARILVSTSKLTFDTPENRYIKALVRATYQKIRLLARASESGDDDADFSTDRQFFDSIRPQLKQMEEQVGAILSQAFMVGISDTTIDRPASMVLHGNPLYSRFDRLSRTLNGGLSFLGDLIPIGIRDTALLYEYWAFLKIVDLLSSRFDLVAQSVVNFRRTRVQVSLEKGRASTLTFKHSTSGKPLYLIYNKLFNRLPTLAQKPDNVIQFASDDCYYIFDAKYRIQFDDAYLRRYGTPGPLEEDINTMHRYRDAIAIPHPLTQEYQRGVVVGAVVLFPHPREEEYSGHRFHKSIELVEIGGLPFSPGSTSLLEKKIAQLIEAEYGA